MFRISVQAEDYMSCSWLEVAVGVREELGCYKAWAWGFAEFRDRAL